MGGTEVALRPEVFRGCTPAASENIFLIKTLLGLFGAQVEFQEDVDDPTVLSPPLVDGFQQVEGIDGLDESDVREDELELVGLEMADDMPLDIRRHLRDLGGEFLGTALGKDPLAGIVSLHQAFDRMEFGNCHQFHG